ncbi:MAG TPA: XRE family transcriptional regulator [Trebonia sp.]|jgi:transcriptional regulator with XRE-family HTH domain
MSSDSDRDALANERLGARLRELRQESGLSLRAVAGRLGISPSAVSQIERGVMRPSVSRLIAFMNAIGVPLAAVFDAGLEKTPEGSLEGDGTGQAGADGNVEPLSYAIRRSWEVAPLKLGGGVTFRRLSPVPTAGVEFFESVYPPNSMSNTHGQLLRHEGYEVGTVTAGELTIDFDTDVVTLAAGDSIMFPCARPHLISNRSGSVTAVATWLIVNP